MLTLGYTVPSVLTAESVTVGRTQMGNLFGTYVAMVLAALAVTTEYRFGTIRASFVAVPNRLAVLGSKTVFVTAVVALAGVAAAFGSWALAIPLAGADAQLALNSAVDWRATAGHGLVYAGYAIIALGTGMLVRNTAATLSILFFWVLIVEQFARLLYHQRDINLLGWMPFANAGHFTTAGGATATGAAQGGPPVDFAFSGPWGSLGYFLGVCVIIWVAGVLLTLRRDA